MTSRMTLEDRIQEAGNPARLFRNSSVGPYPFPYPAEHSNWRDEQRAWAATALLFDQSYHMTDVYFKGPDVKRLLSDTGVNSFKTFGRNKAKQFVAVNYDGYMISDAILFGLEDDEVNIVGTPLAANWVQFHAETGDYDVQVTRDERTVENPLQRFTYRYELTGPNTLKILEKAHGGPIERIKFFNMGEFTIAGTPVRALNHTMSIVPGTDMTGLELFGPAEHGQTVLDAILAAGEEFGLLRGGALAYSSTIAESGWLGTYVPGIYTGAKMKPYREWLSANTLEGLLSLGGSFASDSIEDYYVTPWDLGYGNLIKFDHDFIGRGALESLAGEPHRRKVWLRWNDEDVARVIASSMFDGVQRAKYLAQPYGIYAYTMYDKVLSGDRMVGWSTLMAYTENLGAWYSLGMIDEADAQDGAELVIVWGEENGGTAKPTVERHVQTEIRTTLRTKSPAL
jgi:vanillate/3-O-methylgallate O-demethylase